MTRIVPRSEWGARYGRGSDVSRRLPWDELVVHTEAGALRPENWAELEANAADYAALNASMSEVQKVRAVEDFHVNTRGWDGIAYTFFITFDGTIFEGRGWGRSGAHTEGHNSDAAAACMQGHGDVQEATQAQLNALRWLIAEGKRLGKLTRGCRLTEHRDYSTKGKTCPGNLIHAQLTRLRAWLLSGATPTPAPTGDLTMAQADELDRKINFVFKAAADGLAAADAKTNRLRDATLLLLAGGKVDAGKLRADLEELGADVAANKALLDGLAG